MTQLLLIKAKGGLGNRMLSAVCGLVYAELTGRTPVIDWRDGLYAPRGTNAYPLLFPGQDMPAPETIQDEGVTPPSWRGKLQRDPGEMIEAEDPDRHSSPTIYRKYCVDLARLAHPEPVAVFWSYLPKFGRLRRHLRRDPRFRGRGVEEITSDSLDRWFRPNPRIRAEVARALEAMPRPLIGVHVRHTDLKVPLEPLKAALRRRLAVTPGASVFLATDNAAVQAEFAAEFAGLHHIDKALSDGVRRLHLPDQPFDLQREAENALIDMWVLAGCDHLIFSRNSTFAVAATLIGRMSRAQQTDIDRLNLPVVAKRLVQDYI